jgi:hypothetical protein
MLIVAVSVRIQVAEEPHIKNQSMRGIPEDY